MKRQRPSALTPQPYRFPRFERRRLANGLQVVTAPVSRFPIVTVLALVDAGAVCDAPDRDGLAQLVADLLLEGTAERDGVALTEAFERLGASVEVETDWDGAIVTVTALREQITEAITLLGEVLRSPSFPEREVERLKAERLAERLQLRAEPRGLADEMFARFLYDPASRFSRPEGGSDETVAAITRDDVRQFHETRYRPGGVTLIVAGDIAGDEAAQIAERAFGGWQGATTALPLTTAAPARRVRTSHMVARPQAKQSEIRLGCVYLPRTDPDYHASVVMNAILGGLFSSRINLNLREKHGYTYGAFSSIQWRRQSGPFVVATAVESDVTIPAAREAIAEIDRFRAERVTDDELSMAVSYLGGVFPIRYETTEAIAGALAGMVRYALPADFFDTYGDRVRSVSADDVLRLARAHVDPAVMQLLVVGDAHSVREPLEALGFGPTIVYDTAGAIL
jgi:zinc protease